MLHRISCRKALGLTVRLMAWLLRWFLRLAVSLHMQHRRGHQGDKGAPMQAISESTPPPPPQPPRTGLFLVVLGTKEVKGSSGAFVAHSDAAHCEHEQPHAYTSRH